MDIRRLFSSLQSFLAIILSLFYDCRINYEVLLLVLWLKSLNYLFAQNNTFSANLVDASVVHGCLYSEVSGFFRSVGCFWDFHLHRWLPVVHRWWWRKVAPGISGPPVVHRWSIGGSALDHRWPPVGSHGVSTGCQQFWNMRINVPVKTPNW